MYFISPFKCSSGPSRFKDGDEWRTLLEDLTKLLLSSQACLLGTSWVETLLLVFNVVLDISSNITFRILSWKIMTMTMTDICSDKDNSEL